jgi:hypothetical protein
VLEGAADDLAPLIRHIQRDARHSHFRVLERREIVARSFPSWSMAYVAKSDGTMGHPLAHFEFEAALTDGATPEAKKLLSALRRVVGGRVEEPVVDQAVIAGPRRLSTYGRCERRYPLNCAASITRRAYTDAYCFARVQRSPRMRSTTDSQSPGRVCR